MTTFCCSFKQLYLLGSLGALFIGSPWAGRAQSFASATSYSVGMYVTPLDVTLSDVNRDGKLDILTANISPSSAGVLLNNGNGTFQPIIRYSTGGSSSPQSLAAADLNGDNYPDIVTANYVGNSVGVLLNSGSGTFGAAVAYPTGSASAPYAVATGDLNTDGKIDLVVANYNNSTVGILLGTGSGTFQPIVTYPAGSGTNPEGIAVADVNSDGQLDVITANYFGNSVSVLLNDGYGSLQPVVLYPTSNHTHRVTVADVNADTKPDIITANFNNNSAGVLLGTGTGTFQAMVAYPIGPNQYPYRVAATDVNGDAKPDLIAVNGNSSAAQVLLGTGNGTFQPLRSFSTGSSTIPIALAVADVNGDGKPDIVTANNNTNSVSVLLNTITLASRSSIGSSSLVVWPNPASIGQTCHFTVPALATKASQLRATLVDAVGATAQQFTLPVQPAAVYSWVPEQRLAVGIYLLHLDLLDAQGGILDVLPVQRLHLD